MVNSSNPPDGQQLQEALIAKVLQQAAIADLGQIALAGIDLEQLMEEAVTCVARTLEVKYCKVLELLSNSKILLLRAGTGWHKDTIGYETVKADSETQAGYTLLSTKPLIVEDWGTESRFKPSKLLRTHQIVSGMSVVIGGTKQPFGVLGAFSETKRQFTQDEINFLRSIANILAAAVERIQAEEALRDSNNILQAIIESTPDPIFVRDRQGRYLVVNSAAAYVIGKPIEEIIGQVGEQLLPPDLGRELKAEDQRVMASGQSETNENIVTLPDGKHVFHTTKVPYLNAEGNIIGVIGVARDITKLKHVEFSQRLLASAGELLATSLDYDVRLAKLAQLIVPQLADWSSVDILDEGETIRHVAVAHTNPEKVARARELQRRYPPDLDAPSGVPHVLRTGISEIYPNITDEMLQAAARDAEHLRIIRELQLRSAMVVPLKVEGRTLGAISFVWAESGRRYTQADLNLAEELARRVTLALDNARLYEIEQKNRQTAERLSRRLTSLQAITAALSKAATPRQVARTVLNDGLAQVDADSGVMALLDETGQGLKILHYEGYLPEQVAGWESFPISVPTPLSEAVRTGQTIFIESTEALKARYPAFSLQYPTSHQSLVALPLKITVPKTIGAIGLSFIKARNFDEEELVFMMSVTRLCAQALERARLYDAERTARAEAESAQQKLAALAETRERNRLAQELHDNIAQAIGYLNLRISMADMQLDQGQLDALKDSLQELKQVIGETYTDVRGEIFNLRSETTRDLDFFAALKDHIDKYKKFYNFNISMELEADEAAFDIGAAVKFQIIRTIQEALMNVRKHGCVDEAIIRLGKDGQMLYIQVEDQGQGFDTEAAASKEGSYGLQIMYERMENIGGKLEIDSTPGQGTRVTLSYPI